MTALTAELTLTQIKMFISHPSIHCCFNYTYMHTHTDCSGIGRQLMRSQLIPRAKGRVMALSLSHTHTPAYAHNTDKERSSRSNWCQLQKEVQSWEMTQSRRSSWGKVTVEASWVCGRPRGRLEAGKVIILRTEGGRVWQMRGGMREAI